MVLGKAFRALAAHAEESSNLSRTSLGDAEFRGARSADRLEKKALMKRKNTDDRPVRLLELRAKDRALIAMTFLGTRSRNGRGRPRPFKGGAADVAAASQETGKRRGAGIIARSKSVLPNVPARAKASHLLIRVLPQIPSRCAHSTSGVGAQSSHLRKQIPRNTLDTPATLRIEYLHE